MRIQDYEGCLSKEALKLLEEFIPSKASAEEEVLRIPVMVLIWGATPSSSSKLAKIRNDLRDILRNEGHLAMFSEE